MCRSEWMNRWMDALFTSYDECSIMIADVGLHQTMIYVLAAMVCTRRNSSFGQLCKHNYDLCWRQHRGPHVGRAELKHKYTRVHVTQISILILLSQTHNKILGAGMQYENWVLSPVCSDQVNILQHSLLFRDLLFFILNAESLFNLSSSAPHDVTRNGFDSTSFLVSAPFS